MFVIPVPVNRPNQTILCSLDGKGYQIELTWNARIERWFISLRSSEGTNLVLGKGLRVGGDVLFTAKHLADVPKGVLTVYEPKELGEEPTLETLGRDHLLVFFPDE